MFPKREDTFIETIKDQQKSVENIKGIQFIGQRSITNYKTFSDDNYDLDFVIYNADTTRNFELTFSHNNDIRDSLLTLNIFTRADNSNVMASPIPYFSPTAPEFTTRWRKKMTSVDGESIWYISFIKNLPGFPSFHVYAKFFFDGTVTGTWSVVEI